MRRRNLVALIAALLSGLAVVQARPKGRKAREWKEPFSHWTHEETAALLQDSPWSRPYKVATIIHTKTGGEVGEKEVFYIFTARFFSALPIRESYVREYQIKNNYDSMNAAEKQQLDAKFKRALDLDVTNRITVALDFSSNDPQATREVTVFLHAATIDTFKLNTFLSSDRLGRVYLTDYFPPITDGTGAKFIFPRTINGQAVISPEDKRVRLNIPIPMSVFSRAGLSPNEEAGAGSTGVAVPPGSLGPTTGTLQGAPGPAVSRQASIQSIFINYEVDKMYYDGKLSF